MKLVALAAFSDNYIWMLCHGDRCVVVDPGDASPVLAAVARDKLQLEAILVTHHHHDHVGGIEHLVQHTGAQVFGPGGEKLPTACHPVGGGTPIDLLGQRFEVLDTPGHTAGHVSYFCQPAPPAAPMLFCGDTLFSAGCGRLFEGTPAQMCDALGRLAALPGNTRVCCAHEYTLSNLAFAKAVEPDNPAIDAYRERCQALRSQQQPTLPSTLEQELTVNPFLRLGEPAVVRAAMRHNPQASDPLSVFTALRAWKNQF